MLKYTYLDFLLKFFFLLFKSIFGLRARVLSNFVLYFCVRNALWFVEFSVIFFGVWNKFWYCGMLCYIFLSVEHTLVLWIFVLYLCAFGTRSSVVECCVIFICAWNLLLYCGILCYIYLRMERADKYNTTFHNTRARSKRTQI